MIFVLSYPCQRLYRPPRGSRYLDRAEFLRERPSVTLTVYDPLNQSRLGGFRVVLGMRP